MTSKKDTHSAEYWDNRYLEANTPWDIGHASPALIDFFNSESIDRNSHILIPGGGRAYELTALWDLGYKNIWLCEWSDKAISEAKSINPTIPSDRFILSDFFRLDHNFDFIVEQTFFCALPIDLREAFVQKCADLLIEKSGSYVGLLFDKIFEHEGPPHGGSPDDYKRLFQEQFDIKTLTKSSMSIEPRMGNELFIRADVLGRSS
jgi:thiopurine S-methyltransferase